MAQDEWDVPWTIVGDSSHIDEQAEVIITGTVTDKETGLPVEGVLISADYLKYFDYTDENGRYFLEVRKGGYKLLVKRVGIKPVRLRVRALSYGVLDVAVEEGSTMLEEVVISSRPLDSNLKESSAGLTRFNIEEVKTLPSLFGEIDIVKSLQLMPGVTTVGEGSSGFNVRGGRADQNLILLNDVPLFNSSHALGFVSAFNQDFVRDFSLYKGNVPSNFGGRASSVLDINTRRGNMEEWDVLAGIGAISSRLTVEGPVRKGKTSILLSGRTSYTDWFLNKVKDPNVSRSSAKFYDAYASFSQLFSENSSADIFFYSSLDRFQFSDQFGYTWHNHLLNAKWRALSNRKLSPVLSLSYGNFKSTLFDPSGIDASELTNTLNYVLLKETLHFNPDDHHTILAGVESTTYLPGFETRRGYRGNPIVRQQSIAKSNGTELAIFVNDDIEFSENFSISVGLRYSHYTHLGADTVYWYQPGMPKSGATIIDTAYYSPLQPIVSFGGLEPRLSARVNVGKSHTIKVSYNRMRQNIHLISNTTAPTPIDLWQVSTGYLPPQIADNYSVGYFMNLNDNRWETSVEAFYKDLQNLVEYRDFPVLLLNQHIETELISARGRAYGGELYIRRLKGKLTGWLSYTYSHTEVQAPSLSGADAINEGRWFPSNYNKPHNLNIVLNKRIQRKGAFSFVLSYASGRPFTAVESSYLDGGTVIPIYSDRNEYQIPNYVRMDLSVTMGDVIKGADDSFSISLYNVFGRENAYSVFYQRPASNFFIPKPFKLSILGSMLPSITYNIKF